MSTKELSELIIEAVAVLEAIRREIEKISIDTSSHYLNNKPRPDKLFHQQPGAVLMKRCN